MATERRLALRVVGAALLLGSLSACTDACDLVLGCVESRRVAVDGRIFAVIDGNPTPGASVRLLARYAARVDSVQATSDSRGLFSLNLPAAGSENPRITLRVMPPNRPGYLVALDDCKPVVRGGDGCVIPPLLKEPTLPLIHLLSANGAPVTDAQVTFKRTGGATLMAGTGDKPSALDSVTTVTGPDGFANPFPLDVWAGSNDPIVGDLIIDLPSSGGRIVRRNYSVVPVVFYDLRVVVTVQLGSAGFGAEARP